MRNRRFFFPSFTFSGALLACALTACTHSTSDSASNERASLGHARAAVQGGERAPKASFTVYIDKDRTRLCTGVLIAPTLVLTARHCASLEPSSNEGGCEQAPPAAKPQAIGVTALGDPLMAAYKDEAAYEAGLVRAKRLVTAPATDKGCTPDVALIELERPLDAMLAEPSFDEAPLPSVVSVVGYGSDDLGHYGVRNLRRDVELLCAYGEAACDEQPISGQIQPYEVVSGAGPCRGDSGSGLFDREALAENRPVVLAVVSRGWDDGKTCTAGAHARVSAFKDFIVETAIAAATDGGYEAPAWAKAAAPAATSPADVAPPQAESAPANEPSANTSSCSASPGARRARTESAAFAFAFVAVLGLAFARRR